MIEVYTSSGKTCFQVRLQPRARRNEVAGLFQRAVKIRLTSPPVDNRANRQLEKFLASMLGLSRTSVKIVSGEKSRLKTVAVEGLSESEVLQRITPYLV